MASAPRCRRRPNRFVPMSVVSPLTIVDLLNEMLGETSGPRSVAMFTDTQGRPLTAVHRDGEVCCSELLSVCDIPTDDDETAEPELLILASWRPGTDGEPDDEDEECWRSLLDVTATSPIHLVDWLLVDGDVAISMSTRFGRA